MPPELTVVLIGIAVAAGAGIQQLIKAVVKRQVGRMQEDEEEARQTREEKRQRDLEEMRQKTAKAEADAAKAQEDATQAKAMSENLTNLTSAMMKMIDTHAREQFANREVLSNHTETVGNLSESVDKVAQAVADNTFATRATGNKVDAAVAAIEHLETILGLGVAEIKLLLKTDASTDTKAGDAGSEAAA